MDSDINKYSSNMSDKELKALLISQYIVILTSIAIVGFVVCLI